MKDGRLNKCAACVVLSVKEWRQRNPEARREEYLRGIGGARRARGLQTRWGQGRDKDLARIRSLKYEHKRRVTLLGRQPEMSELDVFAFEEAKRLCVLREQGTGVKWSVDHIVPLAHRKASGLHVAANFQVVPALWNSRKGNRHMGKYFG